MRRENDRYFTPEFATNVLLDRCAMRGSSAFECCVGDGAIAEVLKKRFREYVFTNDIVSTPILVQHWELDAALESNWRENWSEPDAYDWVITNPPFALAPTIVPLAFKYAQIGIAMLLRLSYLEPVKNRGAWLNEHPPTQMIVLPRISFTGDGKSDSVTCAWMVWMKDPLEPQRIIVAKNGKFAV